MSKVTLVFLVSFSLYKYKLDILNNCISWYSYYMLLTAKLRTLVTRNNMGLYLPHHKVEIKSLDNSFLITSTGFREIL